MAIALARSQLQWAFRCGQMVHSGLNLGVEASSGVRWDEVGVWLAREDWNFWHERF